MFSASLTTALTKLDPAITFVDRQVRATLASFCESNSYTYLGRRKHEESILQKIETGRFPQFILIDDLLGYSVIVPNLSYEPMVKLFLRKAFEVNDERSRETAHRDPRMFEFDCARLYCRLRRRNDGDVEVENSNRIIFEIQIRSAFEHAWVSAVHSAVYKSEIVDLRKMRLASQIKAQIEALDNLLRRFDQEYKHVLVSPWPRLDAQIKVVEFLQACGLEGVIPSELFPADLRRLAENILELPNKGSSKDIPLLLKNIKVELEGMGMRGFPRSISVYQAVLVALVNMKSVRPAAEVVRHISPELELLYPQVATIKQRFSYEMPEQVIDNPSA